MGGGAEIRGGGGGGGDEIREKLDNVNFEGAYKQTLHSNRKEDLVELGVLPFSSQEKNLKQNYVFH